MASLGWAPTTPPNGIPYAGNAESSTPTAGGPRYPTTTGTASAPNIGPQLFTCGISNTPYSPTFTAVVTWVPDNPGGATGDSILMSRFYAYGGLTFWVNGGGQSPSLVGGSVGGSQTGVLLIDAWKDGVQTDNSLFIRLVNNWYYGDSFRLSWGYGPPHNFNFWTQFSRTQEF